MGFLDVVGKYTIELMLQCLARKSLNRSSIAGLISIFFRRRRRLPCLLPDLLQFRMPNGNMRRVENEKTN